MVSQNSIHVSDELLEKLQAQAVATGKSVDELAEEAPRTALGEPSWQDILDYGRERGLASGYTEEDVPRV